MLARRPVYREFVSKESAACRLADISNRLTEQFGAKFGADKIQMLPNKPVPTPVSPPLPPFAPRGRARITDRVQHVDRWSGTRWTRAASTFRSWR